MKRIERYFVMEKMIGVINDNLKSVISGIKSHRVDTEKELARVNKEIEDKAGIARQYGISVDDSKSVIASLEEEIHGFENDLVELSDKFKNFKELLATGNKEISNKILEKRTLISKETQNIKDITEKAEALKNEIIELEDNKEKLEGELKKAKVLEKYYESSINSIIDYSVNHKDELEDIGVTVNKDGTLTANSNLLKSASVSKIKKLFSKESEFSTKAFQYSRHLEEKSEEAYKSDIIEQSLKQKEALLTGLGQSVDLSL